ncbi:MAG: nucleoside triphosphate pyrophosphohydrolase [Propionibacterium sp.]|nr:MAG: nucleoside triphosphate pyrophosphohydrolase [Propionibacterium sp.]
MDQLDQLKQVMATLRKQCPWDKVQTHQSLVTHLREETAEVIEAIEAGNDDDLSEELGDLLLQVYFHAEIADGEGRFDISDVARGVTEKLIRRHPHVFAGAQPPKDKDATWESIKRAEKGRKSVLEGIPVSLDTLVRAQRVVSRAVSNQVEIELASETITAEEVGQQIIDLICRAQASGVDADQATRMALRDLEKVILHNE